MDKPTKQRRSTRKPSRRQVYISRVQEESIKCVQDLANLPQVPFSPLLSELKGLDLDDAVISHRILSKFEVPDKQASSDRRKKSIQDCIEYDLAGMTQFNPSDLPTREREIFWNARFECYKTFKDFSPSYVFVPPSGESSLSSKGDGTDIMQKLQHLRYWEVSPDALPTAIKIVYRNRWLRKVVKSKFREASVSRIGVDPKRQARAWYNSYNGHPRGAGEFVVGKMFTSLCTLNAVSRMTTVPKNNTSDRVITCEPFWDMVCQLSLMTDIRTTMRKTYGFDLTTRADLHKCWIKDRSLATIDLKNASNSVWMCVVRKFFSGTLLTCLEKLRNGHTTYIVGNVSEYHYFNMFSPMGCGLTFDVMTMLLWFLARETDPCASVFGDDVLISASEAEPYMTLLKSLGMCINENKTFVEGSFSESCGGYYNHSVGRYILSYDIHYPVTEADCFILTNKIGKLLYQGFHGIAIKSILFRWHQKLVSLCPPNVVRSPGEIFYDITTSHIPDGFVLLWSHRQVPERRPSDCGFSRLMTKDLHRQVILVKHTVYEPITSRETFDDSVRLASWFHARMEYAPSQGYKEALLPTDIATGTPSRGYQFVSILA